MFKAGILLSSAGIHRGFLSVCAATLSKREGENRGKLGERDRGEIESQKRRKGEKGEKIENQMEEESVKSSI